MPAKYLEGEWEDVRKKVLLAGGLKDFKNRPPGEGNTSHCFNDFNHVDLTAMLGSEQENTHDGSIEGMEVGNQLGPGIAVASL